MKEVSEDTREWLKQKWVRIGPDGKILGPCGDREEGEGKPKCLPLAKAKSMSKKDLKSAVSRKRKHDPKVEREGKAKFVPTFKEELSDEEMKKAKELLTGPVLVKEEYLIEKNEPTNPKLWSQAKALAKKKFKIYPSAYANLWASKWYKKRGGGWKDDQPVNESSEEDHPYAKHINLLHKKISNRLDDLHNAGEISTDEKKQRLKDLELNIDFLNTLNLKKEERQSTMKTTKDLFLEQLDIAQYGHIVEKDDGKDHEYEMARSQLATSATAIKRLMEKLGKGEGNLQAWVQSKLTKASDYIDSVADYMDAKDPVVKEAVELSNQVKEYIGEEDYREKYSKRNEQLRNIAYSVLKRDTKSGVTTQDFPSLSGIFLDTVGDILNKHNVNPKNHEKAINHPDVIDDIKNAHKEHLELRRIEDDYEKEHLERIERMKKEETEVQYVVAKEGHKLDGEMIESYEVKSNGRVKVKTASGIGYIKEEDIVETNLRKTFRNIAAAGMMVAAAASPVKAADKPAEPTLTSKELVGARPVHSAIFNAIINSKSSSKKIANTLFKRGRTVFTNHYGVPVIAKQIGNEIHLHHPNTGKRIKIITRPSE